MTKVRERPFNGERDSRGEVADVIEAQLQSLVAAAETHGVPFPELGRMMGDAVRARLPGSFAEGYATADEGLAELLEAEGGCVGVEHARRLFRKPEGVTRQALAARIRGGGVLAYRSGSGEYLAPVWQFRPEGGVWDGLPEVLRAIRERLDAASPLTAFAFLLQAHPLTDGRPPLDFLREGRREEVLAAVEADAR